MHVHWIQPGPPEKRTGGFIYNNRIVTGLRSAGIPVTLHQLSERFPKPTESDRAEAQSILATVPDGALIVFDGLAFGVLADEVAPHAERLTILALCHHPLALELATDHPDARPLKMAETAAFRTAKGIITTSFTTVDDLANYHTGPQKPIIPVLPGVDLAPLAAGSGTERVHMVCVASLTARKGHRYLIEALSELRSLDWQLTLAGGAQHEPETARAIVEMLNAEDLARRVSLAGELGTEALSGLYAQADLSVLPSLHEGYGMVLVEALAHGLPIVSTTAGAIPEVVPQDAGILVEPGNTKALRDALERAITDNGMRAQLADGARRARAELRLWSTAVEEFAAALQPNLE